MRELPVDFAALAVGTDLGEEHNTGLTCVWKCFGLGSLGVASHWGCSETSQKHIL